MTALVKRIRDYFIGDNGINKKRVTIAVLIVLLTAMLVIAAMIIRKSLWFMYEVASHNEQTHVISLIVKSDSPYKELDDLTDKSFGIADGIDKDNTRATIKDLQKHYGPMKLEHEENVQALARALCDGDCDAIIMNESYRSMLRDEQPDFDKATRVIWFKTISKDVEYNKSKLDVTTDSFNVLIVGVDSRSDVNETALNDVNMIATINPATKQVYLTSIPRDYYMELASYGQMDKIGHTGVLGMDETIKTIEKFMGIKIDYYAKVNFSAVVYLVDSLGGIDVYSDTDFIAWTNPEVHIRKGSQLMDGVTALAYVRERYAYEDGDRHRAANQRQVLREIAWRAAAPDFIVRYDDMLEALAKGFVTDMSEKDMMKLIKMQLANPVAWDIDGMGMSGKDSMSDKCYTLKGSEVYVMEPDMKTVKQARKAINKIMQGEK